MDVCKRHVGRRRRRRRRMQRGVRRGARVLVAELMRGRGEFTGRGRLGRVRRELRGRPVPRRPPDVRSKALLPVGELGGRATGVFLSGPVNPRSEAALEELGGTAQEGETLWGCARQDDPHRRVAEGLGRRLRSAGASVSPGSSSARGIWAPKFLNSSQSMRPSALASACAKSGKLLGAQLPMLMRAAHSAPSSSRRESDMDVSSSARRASKVRHSFFSNLERPSGWPRRAAAEARRPRG